MATRSGQVADWLRGLGVSRGDRVLLMLGNVVPLWEVILAAMKLGAVIIPASTLLQPADLAGWGPVAGSGTSLPTRPRRQNSADILGDWTPDRHRTRRAGRRLARVHRLLRRPGHFHRRRGHPGQRSAAALLHLRHHGPAQAGRAHEVSYPVGHLSTMYWAGIQPGDVHLNLSSPGWAKHAWSNLFGPWNAGATILVLK